MELVKIDNIESEEFERAWEIYESSFKIDEKRTIELQREIMKNTNYSFLAFIENKDVTALLANWDFKNFSFIEHFAVKNEVRRKKIGTKLLQNFLQKGKEKLILEVEIPHDKDSSERINFYEEKNFKLNTFDYIQPSYGENKFPMPMFLMSYQDKIDVREFLLIRKQLHTKVYGLEETLLKIN